MCIIKLFQEYEAIYLAKLTIQMMSPLQLERSLSVPPGATGQQPLLLCVMSPADPAGVWGMPHVLSKSPTAVNYRMARVGRDPKINTLQTLGENPNAGNAACFSPSQALHRDSGALLWGAHPDCIPQMPIP